MKVRLGATSGALIAACALAGAPSAAAQFPFPECMESGGGRIVTAAGNPATFGGSASTEREDFGHQVYIDHGAVIGFRFRSITMESFVCDLDARRAEMIGTGEVDSQLGIDQVVQYRIAVLAPNRGGDVPDFYRITLSNGYDSGEQPVVHGNINLRARG